MAMLKKFNKTLLLALVSVVVLIVGFFSVTIYSVLHEPLALQQNETIVFTRGSSIRTLANQLVDIKLLNNKNYFLIWGKLNRLETRLQAGEYVITNGTTLADLLNNIVAGNVIQHNITLIEGFTFDQILAIIHQSEVVTAELTGLSNDKIMLHIGHEGEHPEGRFYPDTYYVSRGVTDTEILKRAYDRMQRILDEEWLERDDDLPFKEQYEALTLASIVEKETGVVEERPLIAGLFINRLRKDMRLQTDPTVIYGIENYDGNIRYRDLRKDTPYNTYTRSGLPPTPIALPGRDAIHATLHPAKTDYLYFVAYGDNSGRHKFSTNLEDHEKAVDKYQRHKQ